MKRQDLHWTDKQLEALAFSGNMCILAGAGSGKTMTLVELMLRLLDGRSGLDQPIELNNILALTYTEKAAREMRDRVRLGLNEKIRSSADPAFWIRQRRQLDRVLISTIHSFCLKILKQYSLEAGLDPDFGLIAEDRDFFAETRREILLDWLEAEDRDLIELLDYFSWKSRGRAQGLDRVLAGIFGHERTVGRPASPAGDRGTELEPRIGALIEAADIVDSLAANKRIKPGKKPYDVATGFSRAVHELVRTDMPEEELLAIGPMLGDFLVGNWFAAKPAKDLAREAVDDLTAEIGRRMALPIKEKLLALARRMEIEENEAKAGRSSLDFDDLLLATRRLLAENAEIRKDLKKRFKVILVDEFQDTNRLQADILAYLAEPEGREQVMPEHAPAVEILPPGPQRLVIFGDPKQSIYRFRGAEVRVFNHLKGVITADSRGRLIPLDKNFRSQKRLIDFFNTFFPTVMPVGTDSEYAENDFQFWHRPDLGQGPAVSLLTTPKGLKAFQSRELEAEILADYITDLVSGQKGIFVREPDRLPQPGDVAVLLRRFTHLKAYEQAFRRRGLDFITVRGQGFYQCTEVWDLINLLFYLHELKDGPALLGLLRSPLVGLDDEALTILGCAENGSAGLSSYFDIAAKPWPAGLSSKQSDALEKARSLLNELTARAGRSFPAELVELAIEKTDYLAVLSAQPQGPQKVANVQRFIEIARGLPPDALYAPGSMARYLKSRLQDQHDDPEAQLVSEEADAVRIMTIHQAKGLQFPVVLVPDVGAGVRTNHGPVLFDPEDRFALRVRDPETMDSYKPNDYQEIHQDNEDREKAEYMRLLYVAATRAQDHLVFSGAEGERGKETWLIALSEFAAEHPDLITRILNQPDLPEQNQEQPNPAEQTTPSSQNPENRVIDLHASCLNSRTSSPIKPLTSTPPSPKALEILTKVRRTQPPLPRRITLNVTDLTQYLSCPRRYYLENLIGLPAEAEHFSEAEPGQAAGAREKGTILHYLLETVELESPTADEVLMERAFERAGEDGWSLSEDQARELAVRVGEFLQSPWGLELKKAGRNLIFRESPVWLRIDPEENQETELILTGEIDLFFITPDGLARIVDYKYASPKEADRYAPQLKSYALALKRAGLSRELAAGLYFCGEKETRAVEIDLEPGWENDFETLLRKTARDLIFLEGPDLDGPAPPHACPDQSCGLRYACV